MKANRQWTNDHGKTFKGIMLADHMFLPLCDDGKTWMLIPVWIPSSYATPIR